MSSDSGKHPAGKEPSQSSAARKNAAARDKEPALRCPRCDSPNTKFCYYNNYSLSQPRHFCKTCRRYWTKGGALRNVPIGGGCRKSKKVKCSPRLSGDPKELHGGSADVGGLRFFQGISPAMDFQISFPRPGLCNQFSDMANPGGVAISTAPCFNLDPNCAGTSSPLMGLGYPFSSSAFKPVEGSNAAVFQEIGSHRNLSSSIESLSFINQDMHMKLQQQRLAMLVSGNNEKEPQSFTLPSLEKADSSLQKRQPILFQNLDISNSKQESCCSTGPRKDSGSGGNLSTEWFFDNPYASVAQTPAATSANSTENIANWSGIQSWSDYP